MKKVIDEKVNGSNNQYYDEFDRKQFIVNLDIGDKVLIQVIDKNGKLLKDKEFIAKYINCHLNAQWQDKGDKK